MTTHKIALIYPVCREDKNESRLGAFTLVLLSILKMGLSEEQTHSSCLKLGQPCVFAGIHGLCKAQSRKGLQICRTCCCDDN